ncbi:hypothetical protein BH09ACT1_BH09ACT1_22490 [soil metagenome]
MESTVAPDDSGKGHPELRAARRGVSRRTVILGAIGAAVVLGAGIPVTLRLLDQPTGKLVTPLLASKPFYAAHRGGSLDWPEMSLYAYQQAVAHGVDALEMSLARTSDGVWFGLHDPTLDRTSGTDDFIAAEHTWAEVKQHRILAQNTVDHRQPSRPYLKFETLVEAYGSTHTIFVDPKVVDAKYYPELFALMTKLVDEPKETFIAKGYGFLPAWAEAASAEGLQTWGYYYGAEIEAESDRLISTQGSWSILGLDFEATAADWKLVRSYGKPVIGHIIPSKAAAKTALGHGARGLMVSGVTQVLG